MISYIFIVWCLPRTEILFKPTQFQNPLSKPSPATSRRVFIPKKSKGVPERAL